MDKEVSRLTAEHSGGAPGTKDQVPELYVASAITTASATTGESDIYDIIFIF